MARSGKIHFADFTKSKRLQNFIVAVLKHPGLTTLDIIERARTCNPHTCKSECEAQGFIIQCERDTLGLYRYTVISIPNQYRELVNGLIGIPAKPIPVSLNNAVQTPLF